MQKTNHLQTTIHSLLNQPNQDLIITTDYSLPLVSCIMPTANRPHFIPKAINYFLQQDYPFKELIIIDDGSAPIKHLIPNLYSIRYFYSTPIGSIGAKRNKACQKAAGTIIVHWDDDDWYAPDWITHQVNTLLTTDADICGLNEIQCYCTMNNKHWITKNRDSKNLWLSGATLAYRKSFWKKHPFINLQIEGDTFVRTNNAKLYAHDYHQGFLAIVHTGNTNSREFEDPETKIQN